MRKNSSFRWISGCNAVKTIYISCMVLILVLMARAQPLFHGTYRLDSGQSSLHIEVDRGGLFKFFGHDHTVAAKKFSGTVQIDSDAMEGSSVSINIESISLTVLDPSASEKERSDVQAAMESSKVLDVRAFPNITFRSTQVRDISRDGEDFKINLIGTLNLHGVEKEITLPASIRFEKDLLYASGTVSIKQTDFEMVPIKLIGGTVRVKDAVKVSFDMLARRAD